MTTPETLDARAARILTLKLQQVRLQLDHLSAVVRRMLDGMAEGPGDGPDDDREDYTVYRGIVGAYAPVRIVRPEPEDAEIKPRDGLRLGWRDLLVFDRSVSDKSPVIRGTWVTVSLITSRIVAGWTWADIIKAHPELTEDDIRAAISFAVLDDQGDER